MCQKLFFKCFEKKQKEFVVETFKNVSTVGVHCWCIKDAFAEFCWLISEKNNQKYFKRHNSGSPAFNWIESSSQKVHALSWNS